MKKLGISLITLVITIVIIIILAGAVILNLTDNNPINSAKKATVMQDIDTFRTELTLKLTTGYTNGIFDTKSINAVTKEDILKYIPSMKDVKIGGTLYTDILVISEGQLAIDGTKSNEAILNGKISEEQYNWIVDALGNNVFNAQTYSIKYYINDGTEEYTESSKIHNVKYSILSNSKDRVGYGFKNWNTASDGTGDTYNAGDEYTDNAALTLYAQWEAGTYTVTYYKNDGTQEAKTELKTHDTPYTITEQGFTKEGYTFDGWNTAPDGTGTDYVVNSSFAENKALELYAKWALLKYAVTYDANGGINAPNSQIKTYGENLTLSTDAPTRNGYTFDGWNTKNDGTGTNYAKGATYAENAELELYAKWIANTYTVTYNANSGTNAPSAQTKTHGIDLTLTTSTPTRNGYTFDGWNTNADGTGTNYAAGSNYAIDANLTLYAKWKANTYTVTYNANSGTNAPSSQTKTQGVDLTLSSNVPTRTGYTFDGWNTNADGTGTNYAKGASYTTNSNLTLYAKWKAVTYTVTYNANSGTNAPSAQTKTHGVDLRLSSSTPTRSGYTFNGWNTSANGTGTNYAAGSNYTVDANLTLYAKWKANGTPASTVRANPKTYYGKYVDYTPSNGCTTKWRIFYADSSRIYLISDNTVGNTYITEGGADLSCRLENCISTSKVREEFVDILTTSSYYTGFKDSLGMAASAVAAPTINQVLTAWNSVSSTEIESWYAYKGDTDVPGVTTVKADGYFLKKSTSSKYSSSGTYSHGLGTHKEESYYDLFVVPTFKSTYSYWIADLCGGNFTYVFSISYARII